MNFREVIFESLEGDKSKAINGIRGLVGSEEENDICACAHAIGHLARRFSFYDENLTKQVIRNAKQTNNVFALGAVQDMHDDIDHFLNIKVPIR